MKPCQCRVSHQPEKNQYGDCLRACVASILEVDPETVPHFFHDGCDGETAIKRLREYLKTFNLNAYYTIIDGSVKREEIYKYHKDNNPDIYYLLFGSTNTGEHVVICKNDKVVHNPSWAGPSIVKPGSNGFWSTMVFVKAD